jgi:sulfur carrier protein ThiS
MKVRVFFDKEKSHRTVDVRRDQTIESLLKKLHINPQTVIVIKNGDVVSEQDSLKDKDSLKIIRVK